MIEFFIAPERTETKTEIVDILRKRRCWKFASMMLAKFRESYQRNGMTRREARERSWDRLSWCLSKEQLEEFDVVGLDDETGGVSY